MRAVFALAVAAALALAPVGAAEAAIVYAKDGRTLEGALRVDNTGLAVTTSDGRVLVMPYDQVAGVSMDGQPLFPPPRRLEASGLLNSDWLAWSLVGANLAAVATAVVAVYRMNAAATKPAP